MPKLYLEKLRFWTLSKIILYCYKMQFAFLDKRMCLLTAFYSISQFIPLVSFLMHELLSDFSDGCSGQTSFHTEHT